eukprot:TRINITY_DN620_c0_g3_i1.p1 TRINITY_DN620_c0_g3~~TRINITY_DN620_c0_g3_i1.p1  ORF type:complete len:359 (-),score=115.41 TRINITY_DN620_c0_g3_i1:52-1128(-)
MKALILVGGYGTRLRPLTFTLPKPCVPFCNKAIVLHQIDALAKVGVTEVILAVNYQPEELTKLCDEYSERTGIKVSYSLETEPMGTAGPLALARERLNDGDPFFVLNSDVTCEYPFERMLKFHRAHGKEGSIFVTKVEDPSKYGVVVSGEGGKIERFVEKPKIFVGDHINAGMYIFNPDILNRVPLRPTSIEKEIFPKMAQEGVLFAIPLPGFWMDIGQPKDYISGMCMYLSSVRQTEEERLAEGEHIVGDVLIDDSVSIGPDCKIGPNVIIGKDCKIGAGVRLEKTTIMEGSVIGSNTMIRDSIVGWEGRVGSWARLENLTVLGGDVKVANELHLNGAVVCPHKGLKENVSSPGIIM